LADRIKIFIKKKEGIGDVSKTNYGGGRQQKSLDAKDFGLAKGGVFGKTGR
jgi:hypothetical protein